jgi:hypothetical protein
MLAFFSGEDKIVFSKKSHQWEFQSFAPGLCCEKKFNLCRSNFKVMEKVLFIQATLRAVVFENAKKMPPQININIYKNK